MTTGSSRQRRRLLLGAGVAIVLAAAMTGCGGSKSLRVECRKLHPAQTSTQKPSKVWRFVQEFGGPDRISDYRTAAGARSSGGVWDWFDGGGVRLGVDSYGTVFFANCDWSGRR